MAVVDGLRVVPGGRTTPFPGQPGATRNSGHTNGTGRRAARATTAALPMRTLTRTLVAETEQHVQFVDVTDDVLACVEEAGICDGFAVVFSRHTTAGIRINEHEPLLLADFEATLDNAASAGARYCHDDALMRTVNLTPGERPNGHAHCRALLLGVSASLNIVDGRLLLGRWQRVFFVELDGPRERVISVVVLGEPRS
jgi:secondary thiamine-phosphate synthase enzyme